MDKESTVHKMAHTAGIILGSIGILLFLTALITAGAALNGLVIMLMWGWFVTPLGLPALGFAQAIGLGFLVRYLTWQQLPSNKDEDNNEATVRRLMVAFVYPFIVLGFGYIAHLFM